MTSPEGAADGGPQPESAMSTGSEEGQPRSHLAEPPLTDSEQELLDRLRQPGPAVVEPVEASPAVAVAADDDSVLPARQGPGGGGDGLAPQFSATDDGDRP